MTLKNKYYDYVLKGKKVSKAERIVFSLLHDFTDRRGLRQAWEQIDEDIQEEMIAEWIRLTKLADKKLK
jgi:hypothetical protein